MLAIFQEANRLEEQLDKNPLINKFKIFVKTDMEIEVYIKTDFPEKIDTKAIQSEYDTINIVMVTQKNIDYDPFYKYIFSDDSLRTDFGSGWRLDTLLDIPRIKKEESVSKPSVVTFYSYKGGMGRTTALCAYAMHIALNKGRKAVIIDCDFEAPGYLNFFNLAERPDNGVIEYFSDKEFKGKEAINITDYLIPTESKYSGEKGSIHVMPAGNLEYFKEIEMYGREASDTLKTHLYHYIHGLSRLNTGRTDKMIAQFENLFTDLTETLALTPDDYLLIDSRTGFNDIFGITALTLSDLIVGFFGSNEQTRPGLYFLLDEFSELNTDNMEPVKLILVNSVIPADNSDFFCNRFKNFLDEYDSSKELDWSALSTFAHLPLHENKVLKELGVQFYEDDEKNKEKDNELIRLITTQKFVNAKEGEEEFNDLKALFNQIDEYTGNPHDEDIDNLSVEEWRAIILQHLDTLLEQNEAGSVKLFAEEEEISEKTFFYRVCMKQLFERKKFIIQGFKGAGKTYLYKALGNKKISDIIQEMAGEDKDSINEFIDIIALADAKERDKTFPFQKEDLSQITKFRNLWKVYFWNSIMSDIEKRDRFGKFESLLKNEVLELKGMRETDRKIFFKEFIKDDIRIAQVEKDLEHLNNYLKANNINLFILFDQLDRNIPPNKWSAAITPLVEFWRENESKSEYERIFPKIFVRTDIMRKINTNNVLRLKKYSTMSIEWSREEVYAYVFKLIFSEEKSKKAFFRLMHAYGDYSEEVITTIENEIEKDPNAQVPLERGLIEPLLNTVFGKDIKSYKNKSLGAPFEFFFLNFSNADETLSLRPFINLISGSVKLAIINKYNHLKPLIHHSYSIDSGVRDEAVKENFQDLIQEGGDELKNIINYLKNKADQKYKQIVLTKSEMNDFLDEVIAYPEYHLKGRTTKDELQNLLEIYGFVRHEERHKRFRFSQMYKYWLGLKSRKPRPVKVGQKIKDRIVHLNYRNGYGFVASGYKHSDLYFHASEVTEGIFGDLKINDLAEFVVGENRKGLCATNVRKI